MYLIKVNSIFKSYKWPSLTSQEKKYIEICGTKIVNKAITSTSDHKFT